MRYYVDQDRCAKCIQVCSCPVGALFFNGETMEIDQDKCVECGKCYDDCNVCAIVDLEKKASYVKTDEIKEIDCDLVVIGAGGSGMAAAARAANLGVKKVVVIEKMGRIGGAAWFAHNMKAYNSKFQQSLSQPDITDEYIHDMMLATNWELEPALVRDTIRSTARFFDWLCEIGEDVESNFGLDVYPFEPPAATLFPRYKEHRPGTDACVGMFTINTLLTECTRHDVKIYTDHPVIDWEVKNGKVVSVLADGPECRLKVKCQACVLAPGGWINNEEILQKYVPKYAAAEKQRSNHRMWSFTGDGIPLAEKAGAFVDYDSFVVRMLTSLPLTGSMIGMMLSDDPRCVLVNLNGDRWVDEVYGCDPHGASLANVNQPKGISYFILSENLINHMINDESETKPHMHFSLKDFDIYGMLEDALNEPIPSVYKANSYEELGELMGIDAMHFAQTMENYNAMCRSGKDEEFFKASKYLLPLDQPPYVAFKCTIGTDGSFGGVLVNKDIQAYSKDGGLIEGLYVTGDFSSGRFINVNGAKVQIINDFTWATTSGFMAGESVAKYLAEKGDNDE